MLRQSLVIFGVAAMILFANVTAVFGVGRTIAEQSAANDTLLVPPGVAFSIWGPIFLGLIVYAIVQGLPRNRERAAFMRTGWWMALAIGATGAWGLAASLLSGDASRWATALLFVPIVAGAVTALRVFAQAGNLNVSERWLCRTPVGLYAGWVSLAALLNWAQVGTYTDFGLGLPEVAIALLCLAAALGLLVWVLHVTHGNTAYAASALWGLGWLAYGRLAMDDPSLVIGSAAMAGFAVVLFSAIMAGHRT